MHLVGIGASAGGFEALKALLSNLPQGVNVAYVVAQHQNPDHSSHLVELLSQCTALDVLEAMDGGVLRPGSISIGPPGKDIGVRGQMLVVSDPVPRMSPCPSVDRLFDSIAEHWGERGAAVILSGSGSDGALGVRAIRAAGGVTIAQSPRSARFSTKPTAAITIGGAEFILEPTAIGRKLNQLISPRIEAHEPHEDRPTGAVSDWAGIFKTIDQLRQNTGIDFSEYKTVTFRRQLQRRMAARQQRSIDDYVQLIKSDPQESFDLVKNLLVSVTSFFRDPQMFASLGKQLRSYVATRPRTHPLRVWVPGCSTGEEAYSLGMLISEVLDHPPNLEDHLEIFATDLNEESLAVARRATYPATDAMAIPETLRARFCSQRNGKIEISESLRRCLVFARHSINEERPFRRLDLVSCRNTLIYFDPPYQKRALGQIRSGLLPGGLLFLGPAETPSFLATTFRVIDGDSHIFVRTQEPHVAGTPPHILDSLPPVALTIGSPGWMPGRINALPDQHLEILEALVRKGRHPCVILNEQHELEHVVGDVSPYCRLPEGRISSAIPFLLPELQTEARTLLLLLRADGLPIRSRPLQLRGRKEWLRLEASPLLLKDRSFTELSFRPERGHADAAAAGDDVMERNVDLDRDIRRLERDLLTTMNSQRLALAELEAANQQLEASAEELHAYWEELRSSNAELHASNLELASVNQQLIDRSQQLQELSEDLTQIQNSLTQGMVIVDRDLRITRYTALAIRVFGLVEGDIGQPILGIPTTIPLPGLPIALENVRGGAARQCLEVVHQHTAYLIQVLPYQSRVGQQPGAMISVTDVSELKGLRDAATASQDGYSMFTEAIDQAIRKRDLSM